MIGVGVLLLQHRGCASKFLKKHKWKFTRRHPRRRGRRRLFLKISFLIVHSLA
jgi:hypothetical protein